MLNSALSPRRFGDHARRGSILQGCLIALAVVVVLIVAAVVVVMVYWKSWTAAGVNAALTGALAESNLSPQEQAEVLVEVDYLMDEFVAGTVSLVELTKVIEQIVEGPVLPAAMVAGTYSEYVESSQLSEEEQADAEIQLSRVARGISEGLIELDQLDEILEPIAPGPGEKTQSQFNVNNTTITLAVREDVSDDDLYRLIENLRVAADAHDIAAEKYEIDVSDEVAKAIQAALNPEPETDAPDTDDTDEPADPAEPAEPTAPPTDDGP